jgi:hypothetical protein
MRHSVISTSRRTLSVWAPYYDPHGPHLHAIGLETRKSPGNCCPTERRWVGQVRYGNNHHHAPSHNGFGATPLTASAPLSPQHTGQGKHVRPSSTAWHKTQGTLPRHAPWHAAISWAPRSRPLQLRECRLLDRLPMRVIALSMFLVARCAVAQHSGWRCGLPSSWPSPAILEVRAGP